ncbi:hypothetical protein SAMN05216593_116132 [Pseudomonas asturiensis]|uniref:Uncharacterized protein n=1 Tax=Pseudomonas asturiensis TaxID=1190415 RepID=A0A1M7Q247_9PSED|nr:hypothetical protein SAMN05216593_116132 [Pseudomonas asturiensis]
MLPPNVGGQKSLPYGPGTKGVYEISCELRAKASLDYR